MPKRILLKGLSFNKTVNVANTVVISVRIKYHLPYEREERDKLGA